MRLVNVAQDLGSRVEVARDTGEDDAVDFAATRELLLRRRRRQHGTCNGSEPSRSVVVHAGRPAR